MINAERVLPYLITDLYQVIILPYVVKSVNAATKETAMVVVLPRKRYELSETLAALNGSALLKSIGLTEFRYVEVRTFFASSDIHNFLLGIFTDSIKPLLNTFHSIKFHIFNDDFYEIYG